MLFEIHLHPSARAQTHTSMITTNTMTNLLLTKTSRTKANYIERNNNVHLVFFPFRRS